MTEPLRPSTAAPGWGTAASTGATDRRIRRSWWIFAASLLVLGVIVIVRLGTEGASLLDWIVIGLLGLAGAAGLVNRQAVSALETGLRAEAESFARILSGLSRSVSPDAILGAIVDELARATDADHIVVVRRRPDAQVLEATLISARPGVPNTTTLLPIGDLQDSATDIEVGAERMPIRVAVMAGRGTPAATGTMVAGRSPVRVAMEGLEQLSVVPMGYGPAVGAADRASDLGSGPDGSPSPVDRRREGRLVADRIAARVQTVFGLRRTLAAPLTSRDGVIGAIVLSHRTGAGWSPTTRRLLVGAADEASAALARAYSHREAEAQATTDPLTSLPNRRYFDEFCGLLARRRRSGDAVGVLMIDIDKFKVLNDTYGHATGDEVLRAVAGAIVTAVREDDVPARFGGEEFVVLLRNPGPEVALEVGERVRAAVGGLDLHGFGVPRVTVSVGVAVSEYADQPIDDLIGLADRALYRAKRRGRDRVVAA